MTKKYDVYGIGNALVDIEFEVSTAFLTDSGIEKGLMTLVDEKKQSQIIESLHTIQHKRTCGGSAANSMIAVAQMGGKSFYSCKVAKDEMGDFYYKDLLENKVDSNLSHQKRNLGTTGKCLVLITPDAERTMNTFLGISENISTEELDINALKNSNYIYIEGYLVTSTTGKAAALHAKKLAEENNVKTALTLSDVNMVNYFKEGLMEMIGKGVDILFCNESEALAFSGKKNLDEAILFLKTISNSFCITLGSKGAFVFDGKKEIYVVATPVKPVDTNGAGDLFAGSFLYAINNGFSFAEGARLGCMASSLLVTQFGARLSLNQAQEIKSLAL